MKIIAFAFLMLWAPIALGAIQTFPPVDHAIAKSQSCSRAKECLNDFLKKESNGETEARIDYTRFTRDGRAEQYSVNWDGWPFVLIDGYSIEKESANALNGEHTLRVKYHVLGHTTGVSYDRVLHRDVPYFKEVVYHSVNLKGGWYIIDPPDPYVSLDFMLKVYGKDLNKVDSGHDVSPYQEKYRDMRRALYERTRQALLNIENDRRVQ